MTECVRIVDRLRASAPTLSVGLLTADLLSLGAEVRLIEQAGAPMVHFDVMDGCFCPMLTLGPPLIKAVGAVVHQNLKPAEGLDMYQTLKAETSRGRRNG